MQRIRVISHNVFLFLETNTAVTAIVSNGREIELATNELSI